MVLFVGWLLGWFSAGRLNSKTASRKEDWDKLSEISQKIESLTTDAIAYYSNPIADVAERKKAALKIQADIKSLVSHTHQYKKMILQSTFATAVIRYRQTLTLYIDDIESIENIDTHIENIGAISSQLLGQVSDCFINKHRATEKKS